MTYPQRERGESVLILPKCGEISAPVIFTIPLQLLAYHVAVLRGIVVDQPRNLAKTVTVECYSTRVLAGRNPDVSDLTKTYEISSESWPAMGVGGRRGGRSMAALNYFPASSGQSARATDGLAVSSMPRAFMTASVVRSVGLPFSLNER